ncbi:unnamed protein product [Rhizoctonia solani]|uniref:Uncharacterized protein n=1 Tax=Rhizoctonia solani TaxID=456999 RepID=A0A8H3E0I6_9AGAM|nr:unnamed protein product [Rhizoctonia solani]
MTVFTDRRGTHEFIETTQTNGWKSLVNCWHQQVFNGLPVDYVHARIPGTPDHNPIWMVTPTILGEPNPDYSAIGPTTKVAAEESARLIAASGHC